MSADIVERLRHQYGNGVREDAIAEITSLRARLAKAKRRNERLLTWKARAEAAEAEIARLTKKEIK